MKLLKITLGILLAIIVWPVVILLSLPIAIGYLYFRILTFFAVRAGFSINMVFGEKKVDEKNKKSSEIAEKELDEMLDKITPSDKVSPGNNDEYWV